MTDFIENYFNSLPENTQEINLTHFNLTYLPVLSKFKKLKVLICQHNSLTSLPELPASLTHLHCNYNYLTSLPELPKKLKSLDCSYNRLTSLPQLPKTLNSLYCGYNNLTSLPDLPERIVRLSCPGNQLWIIPNIPNKCYYYEFSNNPIYDVISEGTTFGNRELILKNIGILNKFRKSYIRLQYALQFKKQFRHWLWVRVKEPKIQKDFHPDNLLNLKEDDDLDTFLGNLGWINRDNDEDILDCRRRVYGKREVFEENVSEDENDEDMLDYRKRIY